MSEAFANTFDAKITDFADFVGRNIVEIALDPQLPVRNHLVPDELVKSLAVTLVRHRTYSPNLTGIDFIARIEQLPSGKEVVDMAKAFDMSAILFEENNEINLIIHGVKQRYAYRADIFVSSSLYRFGIIDFINPTGSMQTKTPKQDNLLNHFSGVLQNVSRSAS